MENITLGDAWTWVLAAAAAIVALSKAWDVIAAKIKPQRDTEKRLDSIERLLANDKRRLDDQDKANAVIFRALYAQINHELSGNGDEILRKSRDEIQNYLTDR
ncbi:MAG: hypothetical protein Q4E18_02725 [Clostridia bacterium]|nr:hypothetical protein [Clostridia bacterium]